MQQQPVRRGEKDEKQEEKDEKGRRERREKMEKHQQGDVLGGITWGLILVATGGVFLWASLSGWDNLDLELKDKATWSLIAGCAGGILLLQALVRLVLPAYRRPVTGTLIASFVLIGVAIGNYYGWQYVWPIMVIGIGLVVLLGQLARR